MTSTSDTHRNTDRQERSVGAAIRHAIGWLPQLIPEGRPLPQAVWESRHRGIVIVLWLNALAIACLGGFIGLAPGHLLLEASPVAGAALLAGWRAPSRVLRTLMACLGLVSASVVLMHLSGGYIEMHFHFFVIVIIIALYQEWLPFLLTVGYGLLHHGLIGSLIPTHVYNHPAAWAHPWRWAAIHGIFVLTASLATMVTWRSNETARRQAEVALSRLDKHPEIDRQQREAAVLAEVAKEINASLDLDTVLRRVVEGAKELCGSDQARITLRDPDSGVMRFRYWTGVKYAGYADATIEPGKGIGGQVLLTGRPIRTDNYPEDPRFSKDYLVWARTNGTIASMVVPILSDNRVEGLLIVANHSPRPFADADETILVRLADHVAIAIQNARLYESQGARATRLQTLTRLNQLISSSLDMGAVLQEIAQAAATLMGVPFVRIWTADEATQTLELRGSSDAQLAAGYSTNRMRFGERSAGWVAVHRCPLHIPDVFVDARVQLRDWFRDHDLSSMLAVPIIHNETLLGVLVLVGRQPFRLASNEQDLLDSFVAQAAAAIRNALLYEALRTSEERARLIFENALDAVITMDQKGLITDWNPQAETIFGWSRREAIGQSLAEVIIPAHSRNALQHGLQRSLTSGQGALLNKRIEVSALHRDGREFPVELAISPMRVGQTFIFSAFVRDITKRKRAEADLQQAKEAAEAGAKAKGEFLANMSHEIRTPMNGILGMTELALDTDLTPEQHEYLTTVKASADALLVVINDILDFSKIEAGKLSLDAVPFDLRDNLGASLKTLALRAHEKGLELAYTVQSEVPDVVVGDPGRLRQILVNLVGNAVKFTERGEVVVTVESCAVAAESVQLHVMVRDTGIGIPAEKQRLILEPFTQADGSMTRKYGGTGLGLAISKQLVELMGGRLWLESEVGCGSTFHFTVCFAVQPASRARQTPDSVLDVRQLPVLVVDDNATNRRFLHEVLSHWHMRPTVVGGGDAALAALTQAREAGTPFPLVLLDAQMPQMDGFTVAERIRQDPALVGATILMLSSADLSGDAARCRELGIPTYLTKPIIQSDLWEAIAAALRNAAPVDRPASSGSYLAALDKQPALRILLAEDNQVNQLLTIRMLEKRQHQVEVVGTGTEVLDALARHSFDLVLMDVQMPELDGFEATAAIRAWEHEHGGHLPIIAMTAHAMKGDQERCLAAGMDGYVSKPVKIEELFAAIDRIRPAASPPSCVSDAPPVDVAGALRTMDGDPTLLAEMVELLRQDYPKHLADLHQAFAHGDASQFEHSAHKLKGAVAIFHATTAYALAAELEAMGQAAHLDNAATIIEQLADELARIVTFLTTYAWDEPHYP